MTSEHRPPVEYKITLSRNPDRHDVPYSPEVERVQKWLLRYSIEHLHGPEEIYYEKEELVVLCLVRNGRSYVETFLEHYRSLGAKHIVFLDNGSTDSTVEALSSYDDVTVLRTDVPYKRYQIVMKRYLMERFGRNRWSLSVDIDELFDYPYSDILSLSSLLSYLNENSYTAVLSNMLDLFPGEPLSGSQKNEGRSIKETNRFYDLADVRAYGYHDVGDIGNTLANEEIEFLQGGVQRRLFGIDPSLSKHPLIFLDEKIKPMDLSDHWAAHASVADFTGALLHYKLSKNLYELVNREIQERRYVNRHGKYDKLNRVLEENPQLLIKGETSAELGSVNELVDNGFLVVTEDYLELVNEEERQARQSNDALIAASVSREASLKKGRLGRLARQRRIAIGFEKRIKELDASLGAEVRELKSANYRLENTNRKLERRNQNIERKNENVSARVQELQQKIRDQQQHLHSLQEQLRDHQTQLQKTQQELDSIRNTRTWKLIDRLNRVKRNFLASK